MNTDRPRFPKSGETLFLVIPTDGPFRPATVQSVVLTADAKGDRCFRLSGILDSGRIMTDATWTWKSASTDRLSMLIEARRQNMERLDRLDREREVLIRASERLTSEIHGIQGQNLKS